MIALSATSITIAVVPLVLASGAAVLAHAVLITVLYVAANCAGAAAFFRCVQFIYAILAAWDGAEVAITVCQPLMLGMIWPVATDGALAIRHGMLRP